MAAFSDHTKNALASAIVAATADFDGKTINSIAMWIEVRGGSATVTVSLSLQDPTVPTQRQTFQISLPSAEA